MGSGTGGKKGPLTSEAGLGKGWARLVPSKLVRERDGGRRWRRRKESDAEEEGFPDRNGMMHMKTKKDRDLRRR